jgi:hypothetical protein
LVNLNRAQKPFNPTEAKDGEEEKDEKWKT